MGNKTLCNGCLFNEICHEKDKKLMLDRGDCHSFKLAKGFSCQNIADLLD